MKKNKISFIIPIYNGEKYIEKCLNNILSQTLKDIEIICVNDGSTDKTEKIINKFCLKYNEKIILINQKNFGPWIARKTGIKRASGEYVCFVDCDDIIDKNYAKIMYDNIKNNNADMGVCGFYREDLDSGKILSKEMNGFGNQVINLDENSYEVLLINTSLWNKIYRSDNLKNHPNIEFPPRIAEDATFLMLLYPNINKISFIDKNLYHYMVHNKSAMNNFSMEEIEKIKRAFLEVKTYYLENAYNKNLMSILEILVYIQIGVAVLSKFSFLNFLEYKKLINSNYGFLNQNFSNWKKSKFLSLRFLIKSKFKTFKIFFIKKIYDIGLLSIFLKFYKFVTKTLKIDIKW